MTCSSCRRARFRSKECLKASRPSYKFTCKAGAATRDALKVRRDTLHAEYQANTSLPVSAFPREYDPKALYKDLLTWTTVSQTRRSGAEEP